ncbi:MAG: hypothetical protein U1C50_03780 [Patescibacteria group bacterium]|nr:hypothetical protein [Patescibacteria group bacterium]
MATTNPKVQASDSFEQPAATKAPADNAGLDWLEKGFGQRRAQADDAKKAKEAEADKTQKDQLARLKALDKKRSQAMYAEIQQQIQLIRKQKDARPPQAVTGAAGYNPEEHQDPKSYWDKVKKQQAEAKKQKLPWTSKQSMGTGEVTRGVSG